MLGFPIAWLANRTTLPGRRFVAGSMWLVLLLPSWLPAIGWQRLVQPDGVMYRVGLDWPFVTHAIMGPFGVVLLLGLRCVPFTYLAITAALSGLGQEFEDAARVHGAGRLAGDPARNADPRAGDHLGTRDRIRRDRERFRCGLDARLQLALSAGDLSALRRHQRISAELLRGGGGRLVARRLGGGAAHVPGPSASRSLVPSLVGADSHGCATRAERQGKGARRWIRHCLLRRRARRPGIRRGECVAARGLRRHASS